MKIKSWLKKKETPNWLLLTCFAVLGSTIIGVGMAYIDIGKTRGLTKAMEIVLDVKGEVKDAHLQVKADMGWVSSLLGGKSITDAHAKFMDEILLETCKRIYQEELK